MDGIHVVTSWPDSGPFYKEKTPSLLAYDTTAPKWGYGVSARDDTLVMDYFKLGLMGDGLEQYGPGPGFSGDRIGISPVDVTTDYLTCLFKFVAEKVLHNVFRAKYRQSWKILYIITVPAKWSDKAKGLIRMAASKAMGLTSPDDLRLLDELQAAALHCTYASQDDNKLEKGSRILMCDAGGGTVVVLAFEEFKF
jgi:hypothetical protein